MEKKNNLLNINKKDVKEITMLDLKYNMVISLPEIADNIPITIKLSDIKYKQTRYDLKTNDDFSVEFLSMLEEETIFNMIDNIFKYVHWETIDFSESFDYYSKKLKDIVEKNTYYYDNENNIEDVTTFVNYANVDREKEQLTKDIIYNIKVYIRDKVITDVEYRKKLANEYYEILKIQEKLVLQFNDIVNDLMDYNNEKDIFFHEDFMVMLKTAIVNSNVPIFSENIGRAFEDYSYREIRLRMNYEYKETRLNLNKMTQFAPIVAKGSLF